MLQHVNKVLVGKAWKDAATVDAMAIGEIGIFNKNGVLVTDAADAVEGEAFRFGKVIGKEEVTLSNGTVATKSILSYGNFIDPVVVTAATKLDYAAPVEEVVTVNLAATVVTPGHRYVLRILYSDIHELKSQFTKSYEVIAVVGDTAATLASKLAAKVNKDLGRRVTATVATTTITLTAKVKTDNEGVNSINKYSQVHMDVTVYYTDGKSVLGNHYENAGAVITKTVKANPGQGNPKVIRDRERDALAYRGVTNRTHFPVISPALGVDLSKTYISMIIEFENQYKSNDNQYIKTTPLTDEIYVENVSADATALWAIAKKYLGIA